MLKFQSINTYIVDRSELVDIVVPPPLPAVSWLLFELDVGAPVVGAAAVESVPVPPLLPLPVFVVVCCGPLAPAGPTPVMKR